jgi:hypothetical protein
MGDDDDARTRLVAGAEVGDRLLEARKDLLVGLGPDQRPALLLGQPEQLLREPGVAMGTTGPVKRASRAIISAVSNALPSGLE